MLHALILVIKPYNSMDIVQFLRLLKKIAQVVPSAMQYAQYKVLLIWYQEHCHIKQTEELFQDLTIHKNILE